MQRNEQLLRFTKIRHDTIISKKRCSYKRYDTTATCFRKKN